MSKGGTYPVFAFASIKGLVVRVREVNAPGVLAREAIEESIQTTAYGSICTASGLLQDEDFLELIEIQCLIVGECWFAMTAELCYSCLVYFAVK